MAPKLTYSDTQHVDVAAVVHDDSPRESTVGGIPEEVSSSSCIRTLPPAFLDRYRLRSPIPVKIERIAKDSFVATFVKARISMTGINEHDALTGLTETILDFLDTFRGTSRFADDIETVLSYIEDVVQEGR